MSHKSIYAIVDSESKANLILDDLLGAGFSTNDISVLFPDKESTHQFAHEKNTKAPEGAAVGATTGGVVGGTIGLLAGIGALAIPGVGPLIAAGPLMAALTGLGVGAAAGGIAGGLIGLGIPELEAKRYENRVSEGNLLVSIHAEDGDQVDRAKKILADGGAEDISVASMGKAAAMNS